MTTLFLMTPAPLQASEHGKVLAALDEMAAREVPEFRLVAPKRSIRVRALDGPDDQIGADGDLRYEGWAGDDLSRSPWGPVVTECALEMIRAHNVANCRFWPVGPVTLR